MKCSWLAFGFVLLITSSVGAREIPNKHQQPHRQHSSAKKHWTFSIGIQRGSLGVQVKELTPELRKFFGAPQHTGVLVSKVKPHGAAHLAGVQVGDVLLSINGSKIQGAADLEQAMVGKKKGQILGLQVIRKGQARKLTAKVQEIVNEKSHFQLSIDGKKVLEGKLPDQLQKQFNFKFPFSLDEHGLQGNFNKDHFEKDFDKRWKEIEKRHQRLRKRMRAHPHFHKQFKFKFQTPSGSTTNHPAPRRVKPKPKPRHVPKHNEPVGI
jgi:membrane-associated protease RseP (regulator of RpoE activity)